MKVTDNAINRMTVIETIENLNLKKTEMVSMKAFVLSLTFLVKLHFSLSISLLTLLIITPFFLLQTAQFRVSFKTLFFFILWIKTPHLIIISSDLLIQLWFYCRPLLTINISCYSLHQKTQTQISIVSLIRIELNSHTISEIKVNTDLTTLSSLEYIMTMLWINMISLRTTKMTIIAMISFSRKTVEWTTSLMRIESSLKLTRSLSQKSMRTLTSITL